MFAFCRQGRQNANKKEIATHLAVFGTYSSPGEANDVQVIGTQAYIAVGKEVQVAGDTYWDLCGAYSEGREWIEQALAATSDLSGFAGDIQARAITALGILASRQSDFAVARDHLKAGLAQWRALNDQRGIGLAQAALGQVALFQGEYEQARALLAASTVALGAGEPHWGLADAQRLLGMAAWELGDDVAARQWLEASIAHSRARGDRYTLATALNYLGELSRSSGDDQAAAKLYQESFAVLEQLGNHALSAMVYGNLGQVARTQGDPRRAVESFLVCWEISIKRHGHKRFIVALLAAMAGAAYDLGHAELAARLCGAAATYGERLGAVLNRADRLTHERDLVTISAQLGAAQLARELAAGQRLTPDQAIAEAVDLLASNPTLSPDRVARPDPVSAPLSVRNVGRPIT